MASVREEKISTELKRELSVLLRDIKDPRIPLMTSVMKTEVTKDLKFAKIYVSVMGNSKEKKNALKGLKSASSFLRREISRRLNLRITPELNFVIDDSIEYGNHILEVIEKISKEEKK
ncbi:MAG: 30S ribosome-binding factor RbfA [Ruminococcaceae bacterium]|nr:30S ribosome-binding factor RbfA [Oscillospiraceae bacterium]